MLKFYLDTVVIWFIVFMVEGLIFMREYHKSQRKISEYQQKEYKRTSYILTIIFYLMISFVPILRLITLLSKIFMTLCPDEYIEILKGSDN